MVGKIGENTIFQGCSVLPWTLLNNYLVEAAGIEPASVSPLPRGLHV